MEIIQKEAEQMTQQQDNEKKARRQLDVEDAAEFWQRSAEALEKREDWKGAAKYWRLVADDLAIACDVWADKAEAENRRIARWQRYASRWQQVARSFQRENVMLLQMFDYKPPFEFLTDEQADRIIQAMGEP